MTTTKHSIMHALFWTDEQYEAYFFQTFMSWANKNAVYLSQIAQILCSPQINRWYLTEFNKLEDIFAQQAQFIPPGRVDILEANYKAIVEQIYRITPRPLLEEIKHHHELVWHYHGKNYIMN